MKKMFIAALTALALYSCDKDEPATGTPDPKPDTHGATVTMTFTDETPTRAFFAEAAAAEAWEKSLSSLSVYVFNAKGDLIVLRNFTSARCPFQHSVAFGQPYRFAVGIPILLGAQF